MLLYFVNIAVISAVIYYAARSLKKTFQKEVDHFVSLLRDSRLPPGPRGIPGLGYLPFLAGKNPYTAFSKLAEHYGDMAFVRVGKKNLLILRDPGMIKEAYRLVAFSDRPNTKLKDDTMIGNKGIIQSVGDVWSEHRRIILSAFRTLGLKTASSVTPQTSHKFSAVLFENRSSFQNGAFSIYYHVGDSFTDLRLCFNHGDAAG
jgi:hypothetical protein